MYVFMVVKLDMWGCFILLGNPFQRRKSDFTKTWFS